MTPEQLAARAYFALVEEVADIQGQLIKLDLLVIRFGAAALPPVKLLRSHRDTLSDAPTRIKSMKARWENRHAECIEQIQKLEKLFAAKHSADMKEWADYFAERFREAEPGPEKAPGHYVDKTFHPKRRK